MPHPAWMASLTARLGHTKYGLAVTTPGWVSAKSHTNISCISRSPLKESPWTRCTRLERVQELQNPHLRDSPHMRQNIHFSMNNGSHNGDVPLRLIEEELGLCSLETRRSIQGVMFLHKHITGGIVCPEILGGVFFRCPMGTRSSELFGRRHVGSNYEASYVSNV
ncbi:hypothetical protein J6590_082070 [Homalodisca vitripennis]|nr:hypothetical protein J6590_019263 [Homalodisca vitripennis]KAG8285342.1 hypothetical protein J6590_082070 [Homalodisca vitripennis]